MTNNLPSKMDDAEFPWSPEPESHCGRDVIPLREPLSLTLARVGGSMPTADARTFERVMILEKTKNK